MDSHLRYLAARQADVVAVWQLQRAGWSRKKVQHHCTEWRPLHRGVYVLSSAPVTRRQLWFAAVLAAPKSALAEGSAGACWGFYRFQPGYEVVIRPGHGGRRRHGRLLVVRSTVLDGDITRFDGIPITTAA